MNKNTELIVSAIRNVFKEDAFTVRTDYAGKSIIIEDNNDTYIYIRVRYIGDNSVQIDISNITLEESIQRKGYFTSLIKNLESLKCMEKIIISNVLTDEMKLAAIKNGFEVCELYNGYMKVMRYASKYK